MIILLFLEVRGMEGGGGGLAVGTLTRVALPVSAGLIEGGPSFRGGRLLDCGLLFE